jgi:hypothetical protein
VLAPRGHHHCRVFGGRLDEYGETRMTFHQRGDVTVLGAAEQIALPMATNGAVLDFRGPFSNGNGIDDLTTVLSADTSVP